MVKPLKIKDCKKNSSVKLDTTIASEGVNQTPKQDKPVIIHSVGIFGKMGCVPKRMGKR
jgi:hypothetical protein